MKRLLIISMLLIVSLMSSAQTKAYRLVKSVNPESGELIRDYSDTERYYYITFIGSDRCFISDEIGNSLSKKESGCGVTTETNPVAKAIMKQSGSRSLNSSSYSSPSTYDYSTSDNIYHKIAESEGVITYMCVTKMYENGSFKYERRDFMHFSSDYSRLNKGGDSITINAWGTEIKLSGILGRINNPTECNVYVRTEKSPHSPQKLW